MSHFDSKSELTVRELPELPQPTHVTRPKPSATWKINGGTDTQVWTEGFEVQRYLNARYGETVAITSGNQTTTFYTSPTTASKLAAAIAAAARWTDGN